MEGNGVPGFSNYREYQGGEDETVRVGLAPSNMQAWLATLSDGWPKRVNNVLFVEDGTRGPRWLVKPAELFAWMQTLLPGNDNELKWIDRGAGFVPRTEFHAFLGMQSERFEAVEAAPHEPKIRDHYYIHPPIQGGDGKALRKLIAQFSPATEEDEWLIAAFFMTLAWGGPYGQRPAFLFTGCDDDKQLGRGVGKTTLVRMAGRLWGGVFDIKPTEKWDEVRTRLLTDTISSTQRLILVDNVKTMRFSWADLEAFITSDTINGYKNYVGDGRRPNAFTVAITLNGASLSKDMAQRCVIVKLDRPEHSGAWEDETTAMIDANRWAIIGDLIAKLKEPAAILPTHSRWGLWERQVLARLPEPERLQAIINDRRGEVDDDEDEAELVRAAIIQEFEERGVNMPDDVCVKIPAKVAHQIVCDALGEKLSVTAAGTRLKKLMGAIPELTRVKAARGIVWKWQGKNNHDGTSDDLPERIGKTLW